MRGVSPSQTLPIAGGQPPHPPGHLNLHDAAGPARRRDDHDKPPHAVPPASFRVTPAGASTARSSHAPAPPYHPAVRTRRHVTHRTTDPQLHARQDAGRSPSPPLGGAAPRPSPSLRSTSPVACAAQAHRLPQPAVCANVNTCRRRRASTYSALRRRHRRETTTRRNMPPDRRCLRGAYPFPQCRNLGPRHQCKFTLKKMFRPAHTPPLVDDHLEIGRYMPPDRHCMPQITALCRKIDMPENDARINPTPSTGHKHSGKQLE